MGRFETGRMLKTKVLRRREIVKNSVKGWEKELKKQLGTVLARLKPVPTLECMLIENHPRLWRDSELCQI